MEKLKYVFYYRVTKDSEDIIHVVKECKSPKRTKAYKELTYMFNTGEIEVFGFDSTEI